MRLFRAGLVPFSVLAYSNAAFAASATEMLMEYWWLILIIPLSLGMKKALNKIDDNH